MSLAATGGPEREPLQSRILKADHFREFFRPCKGSHVYPIKRVFHSRSIVGLFANPNPNQNFASAETNPTHEDSLV